MNYQYQQIHGDEVSEIFANAKAAKLWFEQMTEFGQIDKNDWVRVNIPDILPLEDALKATEQQLKKWKKTATDLLKDQNVEFTFVLTGSGRKNKDVDHLEDRYQFTRYESAKDGLWEPKEKPLYLSACRDHLLTLMGANDKIKIAPKGWEADALVISYAERAENGFIMFIDKDLKQAMNVGLIDMGVEDPSIEYSDDLGSLTLTRNAKLQAKITGTGLKFIAYQTVVGDTSDGYKGIKGFGPIKGYDLLDPCNDADAVFKAVESLYEQRFPEGHTYTDWNGKSQHKTAKQLLVQHMKLAYHERSPKDVATPYERWKTGDPYKYHKDLNSPREIPYE